MLIDIHCDLKWDLKWILDIWETFVWAHGLGMLLVWLSSVQLCLRILYMWMHFHPVWHMTGCPVVTASLVLCKDIHHQSSWKTAMILYWCISIKTVILHSVKLLWNNMYCIMCYMNKPELTWCSQKKKKKRYHWGGTYMKGTNFMMHWCTNI